MRSRFNRSGGSSVSFFAFQDVITGTTGFLIIITIFLALNLDDVIGSSQDRDPDRVTEEALNLALEEVIELRRQASSMMPATGEDPETLRRIIAELKRSIERLSTSGEMSAAQPPTEEALLMREVRLERQKLLAKLELLKKSMPETTREAAQAESRVASLESEVKEAESRLQQTLDRKNVLKLIPERSSTSKEPVLVVVQKLSARVHLFDGAEPQIVSSDSDLVGALKKYPAESHYVVLYFKPSGAARFDDLTKLVRGAGYEIGYDVVSEEVELETQRTKN